MVPIASCPATKENVFWSMANQPTRWRTLVRVATSSRSFFAIKYANELPNRTATQVGVLSDRGSGQDAIADTSAHAAAWLRLCPSQRRPRHTGATGLARPQEHPAHRALHRAVAASVQGLLAIIVGRCGMWRGPRRIAKLDRFLKVQRY